MERYECYIISTLKRVLFRSFTNGGINRVNACPIQDMYLKKGDGRG
jgi:hypothetical protein